MGRANVVFRFVDHTDVVHDAVWRRYRTSDRVFRIDSHRRHQLQLFVQFAVTRLLYSRHRIQHAFVGPDEVDDVDMTAEACRVITQTGFGTVGTTQVFHELLAGRVNYQHVKNRVNDVEVFFHRKTRLADNITSQPCQYLHRVLDRQLVDLSHQFRHSRTVETEDQFLLLRVFQMLIHARPLITG
ncbi:hypothetical protein D3C71_1541290 [compost metagenome]